MREDARQQSAVQIRCSVDPRTAHARGHFDVVLTNVGGGPACRIDRFPSCAVSQRATVVVTTQFEKVTFVVIQRRLGAQSASTLGNGLSRYRIGRVVNQFDVLASVIPVSDPFPCSGLVVLRCGLAPSGIRPALFRRRSLLVDAVLGAEVRIEPQRRHAAYRLRTVECAVTVSGHQETMFPISHRPRRVHPLVSYVLT